MLISFIITFNFYFCLPNVSYSARTCILVFKFHYLRDYNDEANSVLFCMEPHWTWETFSMYADNAPQPKIVEKTLVKADQQIDQLGKDARKALWEGDNLKLARDVAQLGRMYNDCVKDDNAKRLQKICHLRNQNVIGAGLVTQFMEKTCNFVSGNNNDLELLLHKVGLSNNLFS